MINPQLRLAITQILQRLDGVPLRNETLKAEVEIAVAQPITTNEYYDTLNSMIQDSLIYKLRDEILGEATYCLSTKGREAAARYARTHH